MDGGPDIATAERRAWMGLLARAPRGRVAALLDGCGARPAFRWLRPPEVGSVMVRGRAGATGAPFNLGEMTATRCALRLGTEAGKAADGPVGHGWVQGRDRAAAEAAALVDSLMQTAAAPRLRAAILDPLAAEEAERRAARAGRAAATRVDFFTLVRGDD